VGSAIASGGLLGLLGPETATVLANAIWRAFVFGIISVIGALLTEILMPEPVSGRSGSNRHPDG
jgi:hypothetical protein